MKIRLQSIGLALVAVLGTAAARDGSGGYLATVGPTALRFQTLSSLNPALPPLDSGQKARMPQISEPPAFDAEQATAQQPPQATEETADHSDGILKKATNSSDPQAMISNGSAGPNSDGASAITAQMFLRFFGQSTNGSQNSVVVMPLAFTPAQPAAQLSSSAQHSFTKR